jgi:MFS family permease
VRIYYGWFLVAISTLVLMLAVGGTISAFGLFVLPVSEEFNLSRASTNTGIILLNLGLAVAAPFLGRILDLYPARLVMAVAAVLFGASLVGLGLSRSALLSALVLAVPLALAVAGSGTLTSMVLVARWFTVRRGRALALTAVGTSLGSVVVVPLVGFLIGALGWRQSLIVMGVVLAMLFLLLAAFVREKPGPTDLEMGTRREVEDVYSGDEPKPGAKPVRVMRLLKMPQFWTISISAAVSFGALQTIAVTLVPLAQESGLSVTTSASLLSVVGSMAIVGKFALAWLGDHVNPTVLLTSLFSLVALTSAALLFSHSYAALLASSAFLGLTSGAMYPAFLALIADRFGPASFGTVNGAATFIIAITGAGFIRYGGEVYDATGAYEIMFVTFIATGLLSAILMICTRAFANAAVNLD